LTGPNWTAEQSGALVKNYPLSLQFHDGKKAAKKTKNKFKKLKNTKNLKKVQQVGVFFELAQVTLLLKSTYSVEDNN
jgi:hypothetical protein